MQLQIIKQTKDYIFVKIPRLMMPRVRTVKTLSEAQASKILIAGMAEYQVGKTKKLTSLKELRHGHRV